MITRKDIKRTAELISPEAAKVLAKYRTKSRGHRTAHQPEKPIRKVKVVVHPTPSYSSEQTTAQHISLAHVDFIRRTDKYFTTGEQHGS